MIVAIPEPWYALKQGREAERQRGGRMDKDLQWELERESEGKFGGTLRQ